MRKTAILVFALALSTQAWALNTDQLLATIAMPLAVDAVSRVTGVPQTQLADLVTTLNQANVQPTQFVEVIRYVPVALDQPGFVQYVQTQASQGVTGNALVNAIVDQLRRKYNVAPVLALNGDPTTVVVADSYIPVAVAPSSDPLSVILLPLAVAAVSDVAGVSSNELANLVASLNNANVPPTQMVEVLRYVPVAVTPDNGPQFVQFVQQQTSQGVTGPALVPVVVQQLRTYYPAQTQIVISEPVRVRQLQPVPQTVVVDQNFIPPAVVTHIREHPQRNVEVNNERPDRGNRDEGRRPAPAPMISSAPALTPAPPPARVPVAAPRGQEQGQQQRSEGGDHGDKGNHGDKGDHGDKGKGKGKGKD
jgi:hypothetical protein